VFTEGKPSLCGGKEWSYQYEEGFAFPAPFSSTDEENMFLLYLFDERGVCIFIEH
jgi:hypothetical protein